jgi:teichuronic acid exporter
MSRDAPEESLKDKIYLALSWSFLESLSVWGVRFGIGLVLARLLSPGEFGLIGMIAIFIAVSQTLLESGFGSALIQKKEATSVDFCSVFYLNIVIGMVIAGLLFLVAPWIAVFYHQPILSPLTRILSLTILINSFSIVHVTILSRAIDFKTQTQISLLTSLFSGIIGIFLAVNGWGVWSLAVQQIAASFFRTVWLWLWNIWTPRWEFSLSALQDMFGFGSRLLAAGLINQTFNNLYSLVIGRLFLPSDLGYFDRAKSLEEIPSQTLSWMVGRVTFPVFSSIQDDRQLLKRGLKKALILLVMINFPMMVGLMVLARPLIIILLTEKWADSIIYFQLLCLVGLLFPLQLLNVNLLEALGHSKKFLRLEIFKKILIVANIALTWRWGIAAMICGMMATSLLSYCLNSYYTRLLIGYPIQEQIIDLMPYLFISLIMGLGVYAVGLFPWKTLMGKLFTQMTAGILLYTGLFRISRPRDFSEMREVALNILQLHRFKATE